MKHFKDIKNKIKWEKYYDPTFNWGSDEAYVSEDFSIEL